MSPTQQTTDDESLEGFESPVPSLIPDSLAGTPVMRHQARVAFATFVLTFVAARVVGILIMADWLPPWLFFHARGTHVHHLNYGIFLLSLTGAYLILGQPTGVKLTRTTIVYSIGLALTFDEFGMWLHLGGPYWQRASYDAVVTIGALLGLIAYGSTLRRLRPHHIVAGAFVILAVMVLGGALYWSFNWAGRKFGPSVMQLEMQGPP